VPKYYDNFFVGSITDLFLGLLNAGCLDLYAFARKIAFAIVYSFRFEESPLVIMWNKLQHHFYLTTILTKYMWEIQLRSVTKSVDARAHFR